VQEIECDDVDPVPRKRAATSLIVSSNKNTNTFSQMRFTSHYLDNEEVTSDKETEDRQTEDKDVICEEVEELSEGELEEIERYRRFNSASPRALAGIAPQTRVTNSDRASSMKFNRTYSLSPRHSPRGSPRGSAKTSPRGSPHRGRSPELVIEEEECQDLEVDTKIIAKSRFAKYKSKAEREAEEVSEKIRKEEEERKKKAEEEEAAAKKATAKRDSEPKRKHKKKKSHKKKKKKRSGSAETEELHDSSDGDIDTDPKSTGRSRARSLDSSNMAKSFNPKNVPIAEKTTTPTKEPNSKNTIQKTQLSPKSPVKDSSPGKNLMTVTANGNATRDTTVILEESESLDKLEEVKVASERRPTLEGNEDDSYLRNEKTETGSWYKPSTISADNDILSLLSNKDALNEYLLDKPTAGEGEEETDGKGACGACRVCVIF